MAALLHRTAVETLIAMGFSAVFGLIGLLHLTGPSFLKRTYYESHYPLGFYRSAGLWMLLAAMLLALPGTRLAGALLGGFLIFATTELMLERVGGGLTLTPAVPLLVTLLLVVIASVYGL
jgi:hypothetical protein